MSKPTFGSLFAGIGGIDLGLERAGWECKWQVEIDPFRQQVLRKHWPQLPRYSDIRALTSLRADFPVKMWPLLLDAKIAKASGGNEVVYGGKCYKPFAWYDPKSLSWKTFQVLGNGDWGPFLGTWPRAGMMQHGLAYQPVNLERHIHDKGCFFWPTPTKSQSKKRIRSRVVSEKTGHHGKMLPGEIGTVAPQYIGWYIHPMFCEWLMGFPVKWTDMKPSETQLSLKSPNGSDEE